ncbi:MAG: polysaccharide deacetylase family protein [Bacteroidales bacterium]|nr:polysaccharide deacetylase family protein [Bacteroidales bacterium]
MGWLLDKIQRCWIRIRFQPIRVFCFHQVSDEFEPETMWKCDWTQIEQFKQNILVLKKKYRFISLPEVTEHLKQDRFRMKRYAALTADDGWASLRDVLPWLTEHEIPITLFLNPECMIENFPKIRKTNPYLSKEEIEVLSSRFFPLVSIASHGWSHEDCINVSIDDFKTNVEKAEAALYEVQGKTPYYAFTFGHFRHEQIVYLKRQQLIPVYMDGAMNYSDEFCIHRELLDGKKL